MAKLFLWIRITLKSFIMVIILAISVFVCIVVANPSTIKAPTTIQRNKMTEPFNGALQFRKDSAKHWVDSEKSRGPFGSLRIKSFEIIDKTITKFLSGLNSIAIFLKAYFKTIIYKVSPNTYYSNNQANKCNDYAGFYAWLPLLIFWPFLFKSNRH